MQRTHGQAPSEPDVALTLQVIEAAGPAGLDAVGVADAAPFSDTRRHLEDRKAAGLHGGMAFTYRNPGRSTDPARTLPGARALVVGARTYRRDVDPDRVPPVAARGAVARYSWEDHYQPLRDALGMLAGVLREAGWRASVLVDDNALVDRAAAHRAGLGWFGKNTNLLLPGAGSWFVLGSVVTDAPLRSGSRWPDAAVESGCGQCTACLPACPTGALVAPGVLDARRCLAWLLEAPGVFPREYREALGGRIYGCDDCQEACPPNRIELRRRPSPPAGPGAEPVVDLVEMLRIDDDELLARFGRWYVAGRDPAHLRRNALVAIGNVGTLRDPAVEEVVRHAARDVRPIVRGHAVWAAARLGLDEVCRDVERTEQDPLVLAELGERPRARTR